MRESKPRARGLLALGICELFELFECLGADVVLDALRINRGDAFADADGEEEAEDDVMALAALTGEFPPFGGQGYRSIGGGFDVALGLKALDDADHSDVADAEALGEIADAALVGGFDDGFDGLDVVLCGLGGVIAPGALVSSGR